jgi:ligand-binding sensor domain-containing protein
MRMLRHSFKPLSKVILVLFFLASAEAGTLKKPFTFQHLTPKEGLSSDMVYVVAVRGEEVWFGTEGGGATLFDRARKTFKAYTTKGEPMDPVDKGRSLYWQNLLPYNHVSVIGLDSDRVWFGTYFYGYGGGGISYFNPQKNPPWKKFNTNDSRAKKIVSLAVDGDSLWVGSEKGLSLLDKKTEQWKGFYSTQNGLSGNFVNSLLLQGESLWVGTNAGINRLNKARRTWRIYSEKDGLAETEIKTLIYTGQKIWAGGALGALFEYDSTSDRWKKIDPTDPLKNGGIQSLALAKEKILVCRDNGVSVYDLPSGQWDAISASDGLMGTMVFSAAEDKDGIWFGTDKGASRLVLSQ